MDDLKLFEEATDAYERGHPIMSDKDWDELYFSLGDKAQNLRFELKNELIKVKHNHPMLSLDKTKDWTEFIKYFEDKDVVGMVKLDGLTCSLRYLDGKLISAETRGNGEIGEDVLHNANVISSIPKIIDYKDELIIDGEVICKYDNFEHWSNEYSNPRNFAAGTIRLLDSKECFNRNLSFYAWNVIKGFDNINSVMEKFQKLEKLNFLVVPWTSSFDWDAKDFLIDTAKKEKLPIDGLVGRFDDIKYGESLGSTRHHSKAAYAFKFYDELYETRLKDIEWTMGRTGVLTPVAIFEPVDDGESIITRASLHNISVMKETLKKPYINQKIWVSKRNMIIPQIEKAEYNPNEDLINIPSFCPVCGGRTEILCNNNTEVLVCNNKDCSGKLINKLEHFVGKKGLDIRGLSKATLEKLIDWNWISNFSDIFNLSAYKNDWILKSGFGEKSVNNILQSIEDSKDVSLDAFISSIGIPLIGSTLSKVLLSYIDSYEDFRNKINNKWDFSVIEGFADNKTNAILNFDYSEADQVSTYLNIFKPNFNNNNNNLKDIKIVITGGLKEFKNRNELKEEIEKRGGKVVSSISNNTNYLINNDINSTSSKNTAAKKLNIPIISEKDFKEKFLT